MVDASPHPWGLTCLTITSTTRPQLAAWACRWRRRPPPPRGPRLLVLLPALPAEVRGRSAALPGAPAGGASPSGTARRRIHLPHAPRGGQRPARELPAVRHGPGAARADARGAARP